MEESIIDFLNSLAHSQDVFITRALNRVSNTNRDSLLSRYMLNQLCMVEVANRVYQNHIRSTSNAATLTFNLPANFLDSVQVSPTAPQIENALESLTTVTAGTQCAICQESLTADISRIRHCSHTFHRTCLNTWFAMSVRCPVCRYDIRGTDQPSQTSADDE